MRSSQENTAQVEVLLTSIPAGTDSGRDLFLVFRRIVLYHNITPYNKTTYVHRKNLSGGYESFKAATIHKKSHSGGCKRRKAVSVHEKGLSGGYERRKAVSVHKKSLSGGCKRLK